MKVYKYKFSKLTLALIIVGLVLSVLGIGVNIYTIVTGDIGSSANLVFPIIQCVLLFLIPIALIVILSSLLISSYYSIKGNTLVTSFGLIKSKYNVLDVTDIILDRSTNKLAVKMKNNALFTIVVKEEWYEDFVDNLLKANPLITYTIAPENNKNDKKRS